VYFSIYIAAFNDKRLMPLNRYQMAVNIDAQLKRLVEEMREVVDHLNGPSVEASKESDPVSTFCPRAIVYLWPCFSINCPCF